LATGWQHLLNRLTYHTNFLLLVASSLLSGCVLLREQIQKWWHWNRLTFREFERILRCHVYSIPAMLSLPNTLEVLPFFHGGSAQPGPSLALDMTFR
jgi:hypothetical protein